MEQGNVVVAVRVRPMGSSERARGDRICTYVGQSDATVVLQNADPRDDQESEFPVDLTFWPEDGNGVIFERVGRNLVQNAWAGYNSTVFAYGQTGSGKTHTMMGSPADQGLIPRLSEALFQEVERRSRRVDILVNYVEIYGTQEKLADLLTDGDSPLRVKQAKDGSFFVEGLKSYKITSPQDMELFIKAGNQRRATAGTEMNHQSSRSHAIFTITFSQILSEETEGKAPMSSRGKYGPARRTSQIKLVDLAGSEKLDKSKATGIRQVEATAINSALSTLRRVLNALIEKSPHIPFRDSALTKLLSDSLGGNSRTTMIANVSPSEYNYPETKNTLVWACKARRVKNKAVVNDDNPHAKIKTLEEEVASLKKLLDDLMRSRPSSGAGSKEISKEVMQEIEQLKDRLKQRQEDLYAEMENRRVKETELAELEVQTQLRLKELSEKFAETKEHLGNARSAWQQLSQALEAAEKELREIREENIRLRCQHESCPVCQIEIREKTVREKLSRIGNLEAKETELEEKEIYLLDKERQLNELTSMLQQKQEHIHAKESTVSEKQKELDRASWRQAELRRIELEKQQQQQNQQRIGYKSGASSSFSSAPSGGFSQIQYNSALPTRPTSGMAGRNPVRSSSVSGPVPTRPVSSQRRSFDAQGQYSTTSPADNPQRSNLLASNLHRFYGVTARSSR